MGMIFLIVILLAAHLLCCFVMLPAAKSGKLKVPAVLILVGVFLPVWGELCVLACHQLKSAGKDGNKTIGVERLAAEGEVYRSIQVEAEREEAVIPLEEALIINDSSIKRSMLLNILSENPDNYLGLLKNARKNEDVEVVHYAATATTEIVKEYDLRLQAVEADYAGNPENPEFLNAYAELLEDYIEKDLMQGQYLIIQRNQYSTLLQKQIDRYGELRFYCRKTENELALDNYGEAADLLGQMEAKWPQREEVWLLKIRCYAQQMEGEKIRETIRKLRENGVFLTSKGKSVVEFWEKGA